MNESSSVASLFLSLPACIVHNLMSNWLSVASLGKLDSSYCCHGSRSRFLEVLKRNGILRTCQPTSGPKALRLFHWMILRNVKCAEIHFNFGKLDVHEIPRFGTLIQHTVDSLEHVNVIGHRDTVLFLLDRLATCGCRLKTLKIRSSAPELQETSTEWHEPVRIIVIASAHTLIEFSCEQSHVNGNRCFAFLEGVSLPTLRKFSGNIKSDADLEHIGRAAPNLLDLRLCDALFTNAGLTSIGQHCRVLQRLEIHHVCGAHFNEGPAALSAQIKLRVLAFVSCISLTDVGLASVAAIFTALREVSICLCPRITDASLMALAQSVGNSLTKLELISCSAINGTGLTAIAQHCTLLQSLNLTAAKASMIGCFQSCIPQLLNLRVLKLAYCAVGDDMLVAIAAHMRQLEHLDIMTEAVPGYSAGAVAVVVLSCKKLRTLHVPVAFRNMAAQLQPRLRFTALV